VSRRRLSLIAALALAALLALAWIVIR